MNVMLPDGSALELPDGATALDAARAIGPKLAEQAVLARVERRAARPPPAVADGSGDPAPDDSRPRRPGRALRAAPSSAHLLAEAVRRLHPGVKIAIGPPIENGFYYDFEFPQPIREEDLEAIEAEVGREIAEGPRRGSGGGDRDEARARFEAEGEPYKVELVDTAEGADLPLHAGRLHRPLPRPAPAERRSRSRRVKLTGLAGAYWRGDEKNTQLTRIYGTAFYTQEDLDAYLERLEQARGARPPAASGRSSTSSTFRTRRPDRRSGTRRAW